jgi:hypothetical protein
VEVKGVIDNHIPNSFGGDCWYSNSLFNTNSTLAEFETFVIKH